jgi:hypothetical protein
VPLTELVDLLSAGSTMAHRHLIKPIEQEYQFVAVYPPPRNLAWYVVAFPQLIHQPFLKRLALDGPRREIEHDGNTGFPIGLGTVEQLAAQFEQQRRFP